MGLLVVDRGLATPLTPGISFGARLEYDDAGIGAGGFGEVYPVVRVDGRPPAVPLVVKFFHPDGSGLHARCLATVQALQRRLAAKDNELRRSGSSLFQRYPALIAAPQFSFAGTRGNDRVMGYCSRDLRAAGMENFGKLLEDPVRLDQLQVTPMPAKLVMAAQLVEAFEFLNAHIHYIHADLKADNLFVDLRQPACAVIDLDSGALARDQNDQPTTPGTLQEWLAPEIFRQLRELRPGANEVRVNLFSDVWSVTMAVHYLLFGFHPYFFLCELSDRSIKEYLHSYNWPEAGDRCSFFRREYRDQHRQYVDFLKREIPPGILNLFRVTFNEGYLDPERRATYGQWTIALGAVRRQAPRIVFFRASRTEIRDQQPVQLEWSVTGARRVEIQPGIGDVTALQHVKVLPRNDTTFTLTATSWFGAVTRQNITIRVVKIPPRIVRFQAHPSMVRPGELTELIWEVDGAQRVRIEPVLGEVAPQGRRKVRLTRSAEFELIAESAVGATSRARCRVELFQRMQLLAPTPLAKPSATSRRRQAV